MEKVQQGSNTQCQHKQQSTNNQQKSKIHRNSGTKKWNEVKSELTVR